MTPPLALTARLRRIALVAACVPPAVWLHELGHWLGYGLAGLPEPTVHYASSGFKDQPAFWSAVRAGDFALAETMGSLNGAALAAFLASGMRAPGPRSAEHTPDSAADRHRSVARRAVSTQRPCGAA